MDPISSNCPLISLCPIINTSGPFRRFLWKHWSSKIPPASSLNGKKEHEGIPNVSTKGTLPVFGDLRSPIERVSVEKTAEGKTISLSISQSKLDFLLTRYFDSSQIVKKSLSPDFTVVSEGVFPQITDEPIDFSSVSEISDSNYTGDLTEVRSTSIRDFPFPLVSMLFKD